MVVKCYCVPDLWLFCSRRDGWGIKKRLWNSKAVFVRDAGRRVPRLSDFVRGSGFAAVGRFCPLPICIVRGYPLLPAASHRFPLLPAAARFSHSRPMPSAVVSPAAQPVPGRISVVCCPYACLIRRPRPTGLFSGRGRSCRTSPRSRWKAGSSVPCRWLSA